MNNNTEFPEGFIVKEKHANAPDFITANISIKKEEFMRWLNTKNDEWVNLTLAVGKSGKPYAKVDNWKPTEEKVQVKESTPPPAPVPVSDDSSLPF